MKLFNLFLTVMLFMAFSTDVCAQQELDKSQIKQAQKRAKELQKKGWDVKPGGLPIFEQEKMILSYRLDIGRWVVGSASSVGTIYDAARISAMNFAKTELANNISSQLTAKYVAEASNEQMGEDEAKSKAESAMKQQQVTINQKLSNPRVIADQYMRLPNGNYEVAITIAIEAQKIEDLVNDIYEKTK